jgi:laminin alpha 3/5
MCRTGYTGLKCNECENGYYSKYFDGEHKKTLMCSLCNCDVTGTTDEICLKDQGGICICKPNFAGEKCNQCAPGFFNFPTCEGKY